MNADSMVASGVGTTVVLVKGMFGFSHFLWWEYFDGAPELFEEMGFKVIIPQLPWGRSNTERAVALANALQDVPGPIHLIAHSMGGIDARHFISHLGGHEKVVSLTTVSTPHHGSVLAEQITKLLLLPLQVAPASACLTRIAMQQFNEATPDMPGIVYRSYSATRPLNEQPWLVRPLGRRIQAVEGDNDTMVSVNSALWGEHVATLRADHFELIGSHIWLNPFRRRTPFHHLELYRSIGDWILRSGSDPR